VAVFIYSGERVLRLTAALAARFASAVLPVVGGQWGKKRGCSFFLLRFPFLTVGIDQRERWRVEVGVLTFTISGSGCGGPGRSGPCGAVELEQLSNSPVKKFVNEPFRTRRKQHFRFNRS
jgi:hypothetical protein